MVETRERKTHLWDVASGERLGMPLSIEYAPYMKSELTVKLQPDARPVGYLSLLAQLLNGTAIEDDGSIGLLEIADMKRIWNELKSDRAADFQSDEREARPWNRRQAAICEQNWNWLGAGLHLRRLLGDRPGDEEVEKRLEYAEAAWENVMKEAGDGVDPWRIIPPRPWNVEDHMLDLSPHYSKSVKEDLIEEPGEDHFRNLPSGVQNISDVDWDIRGVMIAEPVREFEGPVTPETAVHSVQVGQRAEQVHFLHGVMYGTNDDHFSPPGHYHIYYRDGTSLRLPIDRRSDIAVSYPSADFNIYSQRSRLGPDWSFKESKLAWTGINPKAKANDTLVSLGR